MNFCTLIKSTLLALSLRIAATYVGTGLRLIIHLVIHLPGEKKEFLWQTKMARVENELPKPHSKQ